MAPVSSPDTPADAAARRLSQKLRPVLPSISFCGGGGVAQRSAANAGLALDGPGTERFFLSRDA